MKAANIASPNAIRVFSTKRSPLHRNNLRCEPRNTRMQYSTNPERQTVFGIVGAKPRFKNAHAGSRVVLPAPRPPAITRRREWARPCGHEHMWKLRTLRAALLLFAAPVAAGAQPFANPVASDTLPSPYPQVRASPN